MDHSDFEKAAFEALDMLPEHLRSELKDVIIVIDNGPQKMGRRLLLGLYEGTPLNEWGRNYNGKIPDKITLFIEPIRMVAESEEDVTRVIRETVWHEVGHFFGLDHDRIGKMEQRWKKERQQK
jgi:predicted Zn-dependent protease with MMP-like domain